MSESGEKKLKKTDKIKNEELLKDPLLKLKLIGFSKSCILDFEEFSIKDFIDYAKTKLSFYYKIPIKSEIWREYRDEEILSEYFALQFHNNEEYRKIFKRKLSGEYIDDLEWFDKQIEKNQEADYSFTPQDLKED